MANSGDRHEFVVHAEVDAGGYSLRLLVSGDGMIASASLLRGLGEPRRPEPFEVTDLISRQGISAKLDPDAIEGLCTSYPDTVPPPTIVIAHGTPEIEVVDGRVDFLVAPDTGIAHYAVRADGTVDFHERSDYETVAENQAIGVFIPPRKGEAGRTVTGNDTPAPRAPTTVVIGKNLKKEEADGKLVALVPGRVLFIDGTISVEDEYLVRGDVGFSTGNIRSPGFVVVTGDVLDSFSIIGEKGVTIAGNIGASKLRSGGDIAVAGVSGKGKAKIECGGTLKAHFLDEASVECAGDVLVDTEIRDATVKTNNSVIVKNGVITGGSTFALKGIDVKAAGSPMGVPTILCAGVDFHTLGRRNILRMKMRNIDAEIAKVVMVIGPDRASPEAIAAMPPSIKMSLAIPIDRLNTLRTDRAALDTEEKALLAANVSNGNPLINVRLKLMEGTAITLGETTVRIDTEVKGPVSIVEDPVNGGLVLAPLQPLTTPAREIAERFAHSPRIP